MMPLRIALEQCRTGEQLNPLFVDALRNDPELADDAREIYQTLKGDDAIFFNWFLGERFNLCVNELFGKTIDD